MKFNPIGPVGPDPNPRSCGEKILIRRGAGRVEIVRVDRFIHHGDTDLSWFYEDRNEEVLGVGETERSAWSDRYRRHGDAS